MKSDTVVSAQVQEQPTEMAGIGYGVEFVAPEFVATDEGREIIAQAYLDGADLVIGSIIAAQAYPGLVVAMTPAKGYKRVPPAEKRMRPDKFTVFQKEAFGNE